MLGHELGVEIVAVTLGGEGALIMTTLWPVSYIYFDVLLLFVSAAAAKAVKFTCAVISCSPGAS